MHVIIELHYFAFTMLTEANRLQINTAIRGLPTTFISILTTSTGPNANLI